MRASEEESDDDRPFDTSILLSIFATALWQKYFAILVYENNKEITLVLNAA